MAGTLSFNVVVLVSLWSITDAASTNGTSPTTTTGLAPVQTSTTLPSIHTTWPSSVTVTPSSYNTQASVVPTSHKNGTTPPPTTGSQTKPSAITVSATVTLTPSPCRNCTTPKPSGHRNHSMKPGGYGDSRGKWVATGFAIFFSITTIVMTVLYCRQRKIYRELEGDSSLSRLI